MNNIAIMLFLAIFIEALTEILVASEIMRVPREFIAKLSGFLGVLVHCGYCTSVWISASVAWIIPMFVWAFTPHFWLNYFLTAFVLHRVSNLLHEAFSKWLNRRPMSFAVHKTETVLMSGLTNDE